MSTDLYAKLLLNQTIESDEGCDEDYVPNENDYSDTDTDYDSDDVKDDLDDIKQDIQKPVHKRSMYTSSCSLKVFLLAIFWFKLNYRWYVKEIGRSKWWLASSNEPAQSSTEPNQKKKNEDTK